MEEPAHDHEHPPIGQSEECLLCPVCVLLQALSSTRPDVARHLLAAGRELTLAMKVAFEAHAQASERAADTRGGGLRRIDLD